MDAERKGCSRMSNMVVTPLGVDCDAATAPRPCQANRRKAPVSAIALYRLDDRGSDQHEGYARSTKILVVIVLDICKRGQVSVVTQHGPLGFGAVPDSWEGKLCGVGNVYGVVPARVATHCWICGIPAGVDDTFVA